MHDKNRDREINFFVNMRHALAEPAAVVFPLLASNAAELKPSLAKGGRSMTAHSPTTRFRAKRMAWLDHEAVNNHTSRYRGNKGRRLGRRLPRHP